MGLAVSAIGKLREMVGGSQTDFHYEEFVQGVWNLGAGFSVLEIPKDPLDRLHKGLSRCQGGPFQMDLTGAKASLRVLRLFELFPGEEEAPETALERFCELKGNGDHPALPQRIQERQEAAFSPTLKGYQVVESVYSGSHGTICNGMSSRPG